MSGSTNSRRNFFKILGLGAPIAISLYALYQSHDANDIANNANDIAKENLDKINYGDTESFNVIQNLWQEKPEIVFVN